MTLKTYVHRLSNKYLDTKQCYTCQDPKLLLDVCEWVSHPPLALHPIRIIAPIQAVDEFEELEDYQRCWPVVDLLKARLKSSSSAWRRTERLRKAEEVAKEVKELKAKNKKRTRKAKV